MGYMLYIILTTFLAVIGLVEIIKCVIFRFFKGADENAVMLIVPVKEHCEDIEFTLRSCASKVTWGGKGRITKAVCLDLGMDQDTKQICNRVCDEFSFMEIMTDSELFEELKR